ncbi:MAG TPA: c-type cytochrome [Methylomirabilota bacterium]
MANALLACLSLVGLLAAFERPDPAPAPPGDWSDARALTPADGQAATGKSGEDGATLFRTYCASCHGVGGRGDGPVAGEFRRSIPDLTKYTARNGGVFPSERVRQIIDGRWVRAHGTREMPVWGDAFRMGPGALTVEQIEARIDAIVRHLSAIQERAAE